jgi:hypothetical protein
LNRGVNCRLKVNVPSEFPIDKIAYDVLESSIKDFNDCLDNRRQVKEIIGDIEVDVLRLGITAGTFYLWVFVKEKDINFLKDNMAFTFSGKLVYGASDVFPEKVIIEDLICKVNGGFDWKSIFRPAKKKELTSV